MAEANIIITAGGKGSRMGANLPKQFLEVNGKPIIWYSFRAFNQALPNSHYFLTLPSDYISYFLELQKKFRFPDRLNLIEGGETRFHSIKKAVFEIPESRNHLLTFVHDAARPLISKRLILRGYEHACKFGNGVPAINLKESIREREGDIWISRNRANYRVIQTPQIFDTVKLSEAYRQEYKDIFTDDASVFESDGNKVELFEGDSKNIKITTPEDLKIAGILMQEPDN